MSNLNKTFKCFLQVMEVLKDSWQRVQGKTENDKTLFLSFIEQYNQNEMALYNKQVYNVHMINIK